VSILRVFIAKKLNHDQK